MEEQGHSFISGGELDVKQYFKFSNIEDSSLMWKVLLQTRCRKFDAIHQWYTIGWSYNQNRLGCWLYWRATVWKRKDWWTGMFWVYSLYICKFSIWLNEGLFITLIIPNYRCTLQVSLLYLQWRIIWTVSWIRANVKVAVVILSGSGVIIVVLPPIKIN